jgi:membrane protease YdiL (CAAX protease family)
MPGESGILRAPAARWVGFYLIVVLAALLFNQGYAGMGVFFWLACIGLPLVDGRRAELLTLLRLERRGWLLATALMAGAAALICAAQWFSILWMSRKSLAAPPPAGVLAQVVWALLLSLAEEFFFRGYLQEVVFAGRWGRRGWGPLTRKNLAAAGLFALAHLLSRLRPGALGILVGGLVAGWVMERSGRSLWPAVALHVFVNMATAWAAETWALNAGWPLGFWRFF